MSPDGQRMALTKLDSSFRNYKLWIVDLFHDKQIRLTFGPGRTQFPAWSPDGTAVVFASNISGTYQLVQRRSDGTGDESTMLQSEISKYPTAWSADGRFLAYNTTAPGQNLTELWIVPPLEIANPTRSSEEVLTLVKASSLRTGAGWHTDRTNPADQKFM